MPLTDSFEAIGASVMNGVAGVGKAIMSSPLTNPIVQRLENSGLLPKTGFGMGAMGNNPSVRYIDGQSGLQQKDWKVRIYVSESSGIFYHNGSGILDPLKETHGIIFPYTPSISVNYAANYASNRFIHSNYTHYTYEQSEIQNIQIQAEFTAQSEAEASYVLACIYFFRASTKMFFGQGKNAGKPPPLVFLDGYGEFYFNRVPCIVTQFQHNMPNDVDYIEARTAVKTGQRYTVKQGDDEVEVEQQISGATRIPTISNFTIGLQPVYSKENLTKFDLEEFAQGKLVRRGFV